MPHFRYSGGRDHIFVFPRYSICLFFYFDIIVNLAVYCVICLYVIINLNYLTRSAVGLVLTCFVPGLHFWIGQSSWLQRYYFWYYSYASQIGTGRMKSDFSSFVLFLDVIRQKGLLFVSVSLFTDLSFYSSSMNLSLECYEYISISYFKTLFFYLFFLFP